MDGEEAFGGFGLLLIVAVIWLGITVYNQNKQIAELKGVIDNCSGQIAEANNNIDDLNMQIKDARDQAWSDYDTMGYTLEDLATSFEVDQSACDVPTN